MTAHQQKQPLGLPRVAVFLCTGKIGGKIQGLPAGFTTRPVVVVAGRHALVDVTTGFLLVADVPVCVRHVPVLQPVQGKWFSALMAPAVTAAAIMNRGHAEYSEDRRSGGPDCDTTVQRRFLTVVSMGCGQGRQ